MTKRNILTLALLLFVGVIAIIILWMPSSDSKNKTLEKEVTQVEVEDSLIMSADATPSDHEYQKAMNFILERVTAKDIFLEFSLDEEDEHMNVTLADKRKNFFDAFYAAVKTHDMDLFLSTVSSESISEVWKGELDINKRIDGLERILTNLSRGGTLEGIQYQFEVGDGTQPATAGMMYFTYTEGEPVAVAFQLDGTTVDQYYDNSHDHGAYKLATSLLELEKTILE